MMLHTIALFLSPWTSFLKDFFIVKQSNETFLHQTQPNFCLLRVASEGEQQGEFYTNLLRPSNQPQLPGFVGDSWCFFFPAKNKLQLAIWSQIQAKFTVGHPLRPVKFALPGVWLPTWALPAVLSVLRDSGSSCRGCLGSTSR